MVVLTSITRIKIMFYRLFDQCLPLTYEYELIWMTLNKAWSVINQSEQAYQA